VLLCAGASERQIFLPALANDHVISFPHTEARGNMGRDVGVPLLIPINECQCIGYDATTPKKLSK
jgi:hypothetical protein